MEIPVINISPLINVPEDCHETHEKMTELKLRCKDLSCFYITGHGIDKSLMQSVMDYGRDFFSLSMEKKNAISLEKSAAFRGYIRQGQERTANKVDVKEGIYFGPDFRPNNPAELAETSLMGPNQFPDETDLPGFSQIIMDYINKMTIVGYALMKALARGLQFNEEFIQRNLNPAYPLLALWHYPPVPSESGAWGVGPHTDYGALTLLMQDDVGGLQVENKDGHWMDVPPIPGTFVVNFGDVMEGWTQGELRATMHRVKNSTSKHRISAPFFFQPGLDCVIKSLKDVKRAEVRSAHGLDVPFSFGEYLLSKLKTSYSVN